MNVRPPESILHVSKTFWFVISVFLLDILECCWFLPPNPHDFIFQMPSLVFDHIHSIIQTIYGFLILAILLLVFKKASLLIVPLKSEDPNYSS